MEITINIDDDYMGRIMADIHKPASDCVMEAIGLLRWVIDVKRSRNVICTCDINGQNLRTASIPVLDRVDK
jgi:hypothetical protein